jgi:multicomponent K+:H+ antiporter subunit A
VGTVLLALAQISRIEARAERSPVPDGPADIRLLRERDAATTQRED